MRIMGIIAFLVVYTLAVWYFSHSAGYDKCADENEKAAASQAVKDAKSLANIKIETVADHEKTERIRTIIKRVPDPSGCASTAVPRGRVDGMRDAYHQAGTRSGIDEASKKGDASQQ